MGGKKLKVSRGIEVGHAFLLGTKYSEALEAKFLDPHGKQQPAVMGCYGIGVTRTLQAVIEVHQDKDGIRWPAAVAPYKAAFRPCPSKPWSTDQIGCAVNTFVGST